MQGRLRARALALGAIASASGPAFAQTSPLIIDQNRIDRGQHAPAQLPPHDTLRGRIVLDETSPNADVSLREVRVEGSSLPQADLQTATAGELQKPIDQARIAAVSEALTALYARSDIALYSILAPAQSFEAGVLRIQIVEGHISEIVPPAEAPPSRDLDYALRLAEHLRNERPLRRSTLERYLSLMRDIPGLRLEPALLQSNEPGGVRLALQARRNRADVGVSVSNRATPLLGETQISADVSFNGVLRGGDKITLSATAPIEDDLFRYVGFAYATPIGSDGLTLNLNASSLTTTPEGAPIEGEATAAGVGLSYPLIRSYARSLNASLGLDAYDSENAVLGQTLDTSRTRALRAGLIYSDASAVQARSLAVSASFGIDGMGARVDPLYADADFTKLTAQGAWNRAFRDHLALRLRFQLQASGDLLPPSEQSALGGDGYGRAYPAGIVQGDSGAAGMVEFAFLPTLSFAPRSEAYVFVDAGAVWFNERQFSPALDFDLSSTGLGVRFGLGDHFSVGAELTRGLAAPYVGAEEDWRFVYRLNSSY